jgi:hypothetical protein
MGRDRFVLSNGHSSALLYSMLHMSGILPFNLTSNMASSLLFHIFMLLIVHVVYLAVEGILNLLYYHLHYLTLKGYDIWTTDVLKTFRQLGSMYVIRGLLLLLLLLF